QGLSAVQGPRRCPHRPRQAALLALRALASLSLGQLAPPYATELQAMRRPLLLVPQPEKHRLQRLWIANNTPLTAARKHGETIITMAKTGRFPARYTREEAKNRPRTWPGVQQRTAFTNSATRFPARVSGRFVLVRMAKNVDDLG